MTGLIQVGKLIHFGASDNLRNVQETWVICKSVRKVA